MRFGKDNISFDMGYWEIITAISKKNSIDLKEAVKKYNSLTGIPEKESYKAIMEQDLLIPYNQEIRITENTDELISHCISEKYANKFSKIKSIGVKNGEVAYLLEIDDNLFFVFELLRF